MYQVFVLDKMFITLNMYDVLVSARVRYKISLSLSTQPSSL